MKRVIFYFSATGNTLVAAREFAAKLGDTELISIATLNGKSYDIKDLDVGIAFPVYAGLMPNIVTRFVEGLSPVPGKYFFGLCTCGGMAFGALDHLNRTLRKKGASLSMGTVLAMPSNYLPFGEAPGEMKQKKIFEKASERISEAVEIISKNGRGKIERSIFPVNLISILCERFYMKRFYKEAEKFAANSSCTGCGLCARLCPVGNIEMKDGRPSWGRKCELCYGCINWCPCAAIDCGHATTGKKRYHHPSVNADDIIPILKH